MHDALGRRCSLVLLAAMALALGVGLLAWGPVPLHPAALRHADVRSWWGVPGGLNVLACLPQCVVGGWAWHATRRSAWPAALRRPWATFHLLTLMGGVSGALYHALPGRLTWILAHTLLCASFAMLTLGALVERVDPRFGGPRVLATALFVVVLAGLVPASSGGADLRGLLLLEILPVLLLPAGAIALPGEQTRAADWLVMLAGYGLARLADAHDATVLAATGWFSGHALMHMLLAAVSGWPGYCAARGTSLVAAGNTQRQASLNTAG